MNIKLTWYGPQVTTQIRARLGSNLPRAADLLAGRCRSRISTPGPPRSRPGQPPHIDSGRMLRSVKAGADPATLRGYVQADVEHATYTETGTRRMAARPWMLPSLRDAADDAARELAR